VYDGRGNRDDGEDGRDRNRICCCSQSSEENECGADQLHDWLVAQTLWIGVCDEQDIGEEIGDLFCGRADRNVPKFDPRSWYGHRKIGLAQQLTGNNIITNRI